MSIHENTLEHHNRLASENKRYTNKLAENTVEPVLSDHTISDMELAIDRWLFY